MMSSSELTSHCQQGLTQEELQKERGRAEGLGKARSALEKDTSRLSSELKALGERSEKVGH